MEKPTAFLTGKWLKNFEIKNSELKNYLNFIPLTPEIECQGEANSILDILMLFKENVIFVRSGKGSIDIALINVDGNFKHLMTLPSLKRYDGKFEEDVFNSLTYIREAQLEYNARIAIVTGSFYHHFKNHQEEYQVVVVPDKGDFSNYFFKPKPVVFSVRSFHMGDNVMRKSTFIRKVDGKYSGLDFGSGKVSYGEADDFCEVNFDNIDETVYNVINWLEKIKEKNINFF